MKLTSAFPLALVLSLHSLHVTSEVLLIVETGFIIENKIQVEATPDATWKAFTQDVDRWWPKDHSWWGDNTTFSIDAFAGGCFCEKHGASSAEHMRVTFVDPGKTMRMVGGLGPLQGMGMSGTLEWLFQANPQGTEVTLTYRVNGINPDGLAGLEGFVPIVDQVQALQLGGLKSFITANP